MAAACWRSRPLWRCGPVSGSGWALTLFSTVPLIPTEAFACVRSLYPRIDAAGQLVPGPERRASVALLDGAVQIVPMIQQPAVDPRPLDQIEPFERLPCLDQTQEWKAPRSVPTSLAEAMTVTGRRSIVADRIT